MSYSSTCCATSSPHNKHITKSMLLFSILLSSLPTSHSLLHILLSSLPPLFSFCPSPFFLFLLFRPTSPSPSPPSLPFSPPLSLLSPVWSSHIQLNLISFRGKRFVFLCAELHKEAHCSSAHIPRRVSDPGIGF